VLVVQVHGLIEERNKATDSHHVVTRIMITSAYDLASADRSHGGSWGG